jgi:dTMP kinase
MSAPPGRFITLEGGEGTGKTTLAPALAARLRQLLGARGRGVLLTREPGGTPAAEAIRAVLLAEPAGEPLTANTQALLAYAARSEHVAHKIRPALGTGDWVVCDRFHDSSWAYQGHAGGADQGLLAALDAHVVGSSEPDLTLLLAAPEAVTTARRALRAGASDAFERQGAAFHRAVAEGFAARAAAAPERVVTLDASQPLEVVLAQALAEIERRFGAELLP